MAEQSSEAERDIRFPGWVPDGAITYLVHTEAGRSIRAVARDHGCHASTILRRIRRIERRRDDFLVDDALRRLSESHLAYFHPDRLSKDQISMTVSLRAQPATPDDQTVGREARRVLRRLAEPGACLAVARDMERAVVVRDTAGGETVRTAVVDRPVAEAMALKEWIACETPARIMRYRITATGRAALKQMIADEDAARHGGAGAGFADAGGEVPFGDIAEEGGAGRKRARYNLAESPLIALARRRDRDGQPFLSEALVAAGERLREDFELAQMGPRVAQNWERFLTAGAHGDFPQDAPDAGKGPGQARDRVAKALADLGPGLGDVVLRCCCFLEGMEAAEKRMGWSARSGKIVLRIALQRLRQHYDETEGGWSPMIG